LTNVLKTGTVEVSFGAVGLIVEPPEERPRDELTMQVRLSTLRQRARRTAFFAATVLVAAQLLGAGHFHLSSGAHKYSATAASAVDNDLCAICLLHFNTPSASAAVPTLAATFLSEQRPTLTARAQLLSSYSTHLFGRAPPVSA
jgi:hypothetical protein